MKGKRGAVVSSDSGLERGREPRAVKDGPDLARDGGKWSVANRRSVTARKIPHLFAKVTVVYCVAFASLASVWALWIADQDGLEVTGLLGVILGLFGGELLLLCLKTILTKRKSPAQAGEEEETDE